MPLTTDRAIRACDEERSRTAAALGEHYAAGRLTLQEFRERLDKAYAATTLGELDDLMADLPGTDLGQLPAAWPPPPAAARRGRRRRLPGPVQAPAGGSWQAAWRFWLAISVGAFVIWLDSGASGGAWLWLAVPLGLLLLRRWTASGARHGGRGRAESRATRAGTAGRGWTRRQSL
jgi:hypothetical protein